MIFFMCNFFGYISGSQLVDFVILTDLPKRKIVANEFKKKEKKKEMSLTSKFQEYIEVYIQKGEEQ